MKKNESEGFIVSIITIAKNNEEGLRRTLDSINAQNMLNWELVIVVGDSKDSTKEIARRFEFNESRARVIDQSDSGIYEAMNLGLLNISEDSKYVSFLNSGDEFYDKNSLSLLTETIEKQKTGLLIGGYSIQGGKLFKQKEGELTEREFTFSRRGGCHQSILYSVKAIRKIGLFNLKYRLAADHDFTLRVIEKCGGWKLSQAVASIEAGGVSDTHLTQLHREKQKIRSKHFSLASGIWFAGVIWKFAALSKIRIRKFWTTFGMPNKN